MCAQHPGIVLRHHAFENFPQGTTPHTTAPLDYLILSLSILLRPFTANAIDLAGALISPLLALAGGWFLWWWSRQMRFRFRWALLLLYALSPILVHGTELGRPDHQSLLMFLVVIALGAEWMSQTTVSSVAWGLAMWVSLYEPLILFAVVIVVRLLQDRHLLFARERRRGWICFGAILLIACAIERRAPSLSIFHSSEIFRNWSRTIGELLPVSPLNPIWFSWCGYLIVIAPILIWLGYRNKTLPLFILIVFVVSYGLTIWQARWAYFFVSIFAIALPSLLESIKSRAAVWIAFTLSILPILREWDGKLWPNEPQFTAAAERRRESIELRELAHELLSPDTHPFLAPWWLSPAIAYWSGQPGVAGSSHESLDGIAESARFFLAQNPQDALEILRRRGVVTVVSYDADRVAANSAAILATQIPAHPLCRSIDRTPALAPRFLVLVSQNGTGKIFQVANNR